jgi:Arc/MetJ family transcription regulator
VKLTIDIPEEELQEAMRNPGLRSKRGAVVAALANFNRRHRLEQLAKQFGSFDGFDPITQIRRTGEP